MKLVIPRRIGVILLQAILVVIIVRTIAKHEIPMVLAIFSALVIGELIVIFSNLKMRYWFPSLPVYFFLGAYSLGPDFLFSNPYDPDFILYSTLWLAVIQIIIMIAVTIMEHNSKLETSKLKIIKTACFGEHSETNINIFKPWRDLIYAVILQMATFIYLYFNDAMDYEINYNIPTMPLLVIVPIVLVAFIPIVLKLKIRYWALSIGVFGFLVDISSHSNLSVGVAYIVFILLAFAQVLVISAYSLVRFVIRFCKALKTDNSYDSKAWDSLSEPLQKAPGQN
ncbi:MAG: hypothetical protein LBT59_01595 [Clostridiales bacterium]|jgi:hypothetical protein|nr:hypothetical protein [Clostridiales bacterium]